MSVTTKAKATHAPVHTAVKAKTAAPAKAHAPAKAKAAAATKAAPAAKPTDGLLATKPAAKGAHHATAVAGEKLPPSASTDELFGGARAGATRGSRARRASAEAASHPTSLAALDLSKVGNTAAGANVQLDGALAAGMEFRLTQIVDRQGQPGLEVDCRLTPQASADLAGKVAAWAAAGATHSRGSFTVEAREFKNGATTLTAAPAYVVANSTCESLSKPGAYTVEFAPSKGNPQAYKDRLRVRVFGATDGERRKNLAQAMAAIKLDPLVEDASPEQTEKLHRLSVLRMVAPPVAEELSTHLGNVSLQDLDAALETAGVPRARLEKVAIKEVFPGHLAAVDPVLGETYARAGVKALMVGVRAVESVVKILQSDGLMSSAERYGRGIFTPGASLSADESSGGAEFAFMRMVTEQAVKGNSAISTSYGAGTVQLLITGDQLKGQLSRTDWHAYPDDMFGTAISASQQKDDPSLTSYSRGAVFSQRLTGPKLVEAVNGGSTPSFKPSNEVCLKAGVPAGSFSGLVVGSEVVKAQLLEALKQGGITQLQGRPIADCITIATTWGQVGPALPAAA